MKKKIIILVIVLIVSMTTLIGPAIYLYVYDFVLNIEYLGSALGTIASMIPLFIMGSIGMIYSVKNLFELL